MGEVSLAPTADALQGKQRMEAALKGMSHVPVPREADPNGIDQHAPGAKMDAHKIKAGVLLDFSRALTEVARVGTYGADKYSRGSWPYVSNGMTRYTDAMMRHLLAEHSNDEPFDPESGLLHAAHMAWNSLARLELLLRELEE